MHSYVQNSYNKTDEMH